MTDIAKKKGIARGITITRKGWAILAQMDRGNYKSLTTAEARKKSGRRGLRAIRRNRRLQEAA